MHCGLQAGNLRDAGEPPQGFDGCCGGQAVAGAVFGGGAAGGMKVVGEARPGDVKQGAGERLQPVKEGRDAAQVLAKGGVGEGEQDLVSVAGLCRRVADPKPQLAGVAAGLKKASECGFAGGAPAVFEGFGGGCGAQGGQARRRRLQVGRAASGWRSRATRGKGISPKARQAHGWARQAGWRG